MVALITGFIAGLVFYCVTVFPLAIVFGFSGDVWGGVCMLYGVVCGSVGVLWGMDSR